MATQLAIGYLTTGARNPRARPVAQPRSAHVTEHDSISARPAIPQAVISWTSSDLQEAWPVGAGEPAVAIDGPPPFQPVGEKRPGVVARISVDAVMFGALAVMLVGLAGAVAKAGEQPNVAWAPRDAATLAAVGTAKVPVVDVRIVRAGGVAQADVPDEKLANAATPRPAN